MRSQWGRYNLPRIIIDKSPYRNKHSSEGVNMSMLLFSILTYRYRSLHTWDHLGYISKREIDWLWLKNIFKNLFYSSGIYLLSFKNEVYIFSDSLQPHLPHFLSAGCHSCAISAACGVKLNSVHILRTFSGQEKAPSEKHSMSSWNVI